MLEDTIVLFDTAISYKGKLLTLVLLNPDKPCLCKQCRSRSVGFWKPTDLDLHCLSLSIWICINNCLKQSDWLTVRSGCGILIYSAGQGLINILNNKKVKVMYKRHTSSIQSKFKWSKTKNSGRQNRSLRVPASTEEYRVSHPYLVEVHVFYYILLYSPLRRKKKLHDNCI